MGTGLELFWFLLGRMAAVMGAALLLPLAVSLALREPLWWTFALPTLGSALLGIFLMRRLGRNHKRQLSMREGVLFMAISWFFLGLIGMLPYWLSGTANFTAAFFESMSSLTTTGSSCLTIAEQDLPHSLIFWGSMLDWVGGLNFIVMLVTVLPQVSGCFGLTLSARQSVFFSPMYNRMQRAAMQGATVYAVLTLVSFALYWLAGLGAFAAFTLALRTISTGGGSSFLEFMVYDNPFLELAAGASMLLSSGNFLLYGKIIDRKNPLGLLRDTEMRTFLLVLAGAGMLISWHLWRQGVYGSWADSLRFGYFQAVSFLSTSGFASAVFQSWPDFDRYVLFLLAFAGGCIGSATGGLKIMRFVVLLRLAAQELRRTLHPHMVMVVKVDGMPVTMKLVGRILSFFFLYMAAFCLFSLMISLSGVSMLEAMGIAAGCLSSTGSTAELCGLVDFSLLPGWAKYCCTFLMVLGRIEIFSFLVLLDLGAQLFQRKW